MLAADELLAEDIRVRSPRCPFEAKMTFLVRNLHLKVLDDFILQGSMQDWRMDDMTEWPVNATKGQFRRRGRLPSSETL